MSAAEEEDRVAERHALRLFVGIIEAMNWTDTRAKVSILRALHRASLLLVVSDSPQEVTREQLDAGELRLMESLTAWHNSIVTTSKGGAA